MTIYPGKLAKTKNANITTQMSRTAPTITKSSPVYDKYRFDEIEEQ